MIQGYCRTNLDGYERVTWPRVFAGVPQRGDYVQATKGGKILKVYSVTHYSIIAESGVEHPRIEVELNKCVPLENRR